MCRYTGNATVADDLEGGAATAFGLLGVITAGSGDDGKSTLIGRRWRSAQTLPPTAT